MKTDDLVALLANGNVAVAPHALERRLLVGISVGSIGAVVLMVTLLGVRPDLLAATHQPMFWVKSLFAASLALAALVTAARLSRPGVALGRAPLAVVSPLFGMWLLGALVLVSAAPEQRVKLLFGATWNDCPLLIALLALPVFVGTLWSVSGLAPTRLRLAGATSGLLAGAVATLVYCLHCPEMAAPFVALWYVLGMAVPTVLGALLGPRLLRW
jgi:hypothetical protein